MIATELEIAKGIEVRNTLEHDFAEIAEISRLIYPGEYPWTPGELASHRSVFPEGQFVAIERRSGKVVGMAASLIIRWRDYPLDASWRQITADEKFTNHDPVRGHTLYGAEVMVHPQQQGKKIGRVLYRARKALCRRLGLKRILAGARLVGYHKWAGALSPAEYVRRVISGELVDKTLTFQLKRGFRVLGVVDGYLPDDPKSLGYAALIEWKPRKGRDFRAA